MDIQAEALKFHGIRGHKWRRAGVLGFGRDDFENADAAGRRRAEMQLAERAFGRFVQVERDRLQTGQTGHGDDFGPIRRIGRFIFRARFGCEAVEHIANRFKMDPAVNQRVAEPGLKVGVESGLLAEGRDCAAGLASENFFNGFGIAADDQKRFGLAHRNRGF